MSLEYNIHWVYTNIIQTYLCRIQFRIELLILILHHQIGTVEIKKIYNLRTKPKSRFQIGFLPRASPPLANFAFCWHTEWIFLPLRSTIYHFSESLRHAANNNNH